ncbi:hypothetical protein HDU77_001399 [Chytriomyces hyalinus]|nr:hypothetical protein HDU77_001399 [Chytriomyces hyalinus]
MTTALTASTDASLSNSLSLSNASRIKDYAPSSTWSNASTEQSFDAQATMHVQDLLEKLETYMYKECASLATSKNMNQLSDECDEWSILFPHIRVRGTNPTPFKELGFQHYSHDSIRSDKTRPISPYFYSPNSTFESNALEITGVNLSKDAVIRHMQNEAVQNTEWNCPGEDWTTWNEQSLLDWGDAVDALVQRKLDWCILSSQSNESSKSEPDARSLTPTPDDPHSSRSLPKPKSHRIQIIKSGLNGIEALKTSLKSFADSNKFKTHLIFGLVVLDANELKKIGTNTQLGEVSGSVLAFIHWNQNVPSKSAENAILVVDIEEEDLSSADSASPDTKSLVGSMKDDFNRGISQVDAHDIAIAFERSNWPIVELVYESLAKCTSPKSSYLCIQLVVNPTARSITEDGEEILAIDGEVEEYFAHEKDGDELTGDPTNGRSSPRRKGLPPVTPNASIRQDIIDHLFDDMWSEIVPIFNPLLSNDDESLDTQRDQGAQDLTIFSNYFSDDDDEDNEDDEDDQDSDESSENLLSAMTIKSLPLQRRESSARVKMSFESIAALESLHGSSRPASARPVSSARLASANIQLNATRPASGRTIELYHNFQMQQQQQSQHAHAQLQQQQQQQQQNQQHSHNASPAALHARLQSAAGTRSSAGNRSIKRNNIGMRLTPISSMPPLGASNVSSSMSMNDVLFGTSIGISSGKAAMDNSRPSTSIGVSSKRLPPIRLSMQHSQEVDNLSVTALGVHGSPKNMNRHVLFDAPDSADQPKANRATSPRPYSAKRQPSGGFPRSQLSLSRPQTAIDHSRMNHVASGTTVKNKRSALGSAIHGSEERSISPVLGTRFGRKKNS